MIYYKYINGKYPEYIFIIKDGKVKCLVLEGPLYKCSNPANPFVYTWVSKEELERTSLFNAWKILKEADVSYIWLKNRVISDIKEELGYVEL